jgi:ATP-dependent RNA helicase DeaD
MSSASVTSSTTTFRTTPKPTCTVSAAPDALARAGRKGDAILFVAPREQRMLQSIERATRQKIDLMQLPSTDMVNNRRIEKFKQRITDTLSDQDLSLFKDLITQYQQEKEIDTLDIAAALAKQVQGSAPFLLSGKSHEKPARAFEFDGSARERKPRGDKSAAAYEDKRKPRRNAETAYDDKRKPRRNENDAEQQPLEAGKDRFRIEVGHNHDVKPGNIVGAIANEADLDSKFIGRINIFDDYSLVDLPENMPKELLESLKPVRVAGQRMNISQVGGRKAGTDGEKPLRARPKVRHQAKKDKGKPKRIRKSK